MSLVWVCVLCECIVLYYCVLQTIVRSTVNHRHIPIHIPIHTLFPVPPADDCAVVTVECLWRCFIIFSYCRMKRDKREREG